MEFNASNTNRHKLMAMGKPIKAKNGGSIMKKAAGGGVTKGSDGMTAKAATGKAKADRQGKALMPGRMKGNLTMIAPQSAYAKGGSAKKLFAGKETYAEEMKEAKALKSGKISMKAYAKGEKSEGVHKKNGGMTKKRSAC
jgi:hypothetical protein